MKKIGRSKEQRARNEGGEPRAFALFELFGWSEAKEMHAVFRMDGRSVAHLYGEGARPLLKRLLCGDVRAMTEGVFVHSPMLNLQGGTMDHVLVYCDRADSYRLILHECSREKDLRHIRRELTPDVELEDCAETLRLYAVTGPCAGELLQNAPAFFAAPANCMGEDGWVVCVQREAVSTFEAHLAQQGCELHSQTEMDIRMIESGVPAYGRELDDTINPLEAGLSRTVRLDRIGFIGREALVAAGTPRRGVIGLVVSAEGARRGQNVVHRNKDVGVITSACFSPRMQAWIALALVELPYQEPGRMLRVENGDELIEAHVSALPFPRETI